MKIFHKIEFKKNSHLLHFAQLNNSLKLINKKRHNLQQINYRINTESNPIDG
jgi:hypothetical protein